jgi:hypothetical protein
MLSVTVDPITIDRLDALSASTGLSRGRIVDAALESWTPPKDARLAIVGR